MDTNELGELGVILVKEQLIRIGLFAVEMPSQQFDFDLYTNNDLRIEVKSARKRTDTVKKQDKYEYEQTSWTFNNTFENSTSRKEGIKSARKQRQCDFYILVCFNQNCDVEKYYVVPNQVINHKSKLISINENKTARPSKSKFAPYLNNWDPLLLTIKESETEDGVNAS